MTHYREPTHSTSRTETHSVLALAHSTLMASKLLLLIAMTTPYSSSRHTTPPTFAMGRFTARIFVTGLLPSDDNGGSGNQPDKSRCWLLGKVRGAVRPRRLDRPGRSISRGPLRLLWSDLDRGRTRMCATYQRAEQPNHTHEMRRDPLAVALAQSS